MDRNEKQRILIVDDEKFYIDVLVNLLQDDYDVIIAKTGELALKRALNKTLPDLILLDIVMPGIDGYEVCRQLKDNQRTRDIPVIFLTVKSEVDDEIRGFELGAVDYIAKPMSPPIVMSRVKNHLMLTQARKFLQDQHAVLKHQVEEQTREISRTQDVAIYCMASLAETRDNDTGNHIRRTQHYIRLLCHYLRDKAGYKDYLDDNTIDLLFKSAPLHDIGKVGVPDKVLLKPGPLDEDEWHEMKKHPLIGYETLLNAEKQLGRSSFLDIAGEITLTHHEKWDGSGYPKGLKAEEIPIPGRLMALADVYDALISKRVYKEAFSHHKSAELIISMKGSYFDPLIIEAFEQLKDEFKLVAEKFNDSNVTD